MPFFFAVTESSLLLNFIALNWEQSNTFPGQGVHCLEDEKEGCFATCFLILPTS